MSVYGRLGIVMAAAALWSVAAAGSVSAQVCGDADGNGNVTVTDGVQTLRSAAGLSSSCSEHANSCDVDGSGGTTVTDGVNVLRKAAGLTITEACPSGGGVGDAQEVSDIVVPFLALGLSELRNVSPTSADVRPAATEDCEDGGTRTTDQSGATASVTFNACKVSEPGLGSFQFDGQIVAQLGIPTSTISFEFHVTNLATSEQVDFDGSLQGTARIQGGFVVDGGPLVVRGPNEGPEIFRVTFNDLTVDGDGHIQSGSVEAEDTSDSFDLETAEFEVEDGSTTASLHVKRDDGSEQDFIVNLETGDIS
jgi:hypothetical protein